MSISAHILGKICMFLMSSSPQKEMITTFCQTNANMMMC